MTVQYLKKDNAWLNIELWHPNEIQYYGVTHIYLRHTDIFDMFQNVGHEATFSKRYLKNRAKFVLFWSTV